MLSIARSATEKLAAILAGSNGLPTAVEALTTQQGLTLPQIGPQQIVPQNVAPDIAEKSIASKYPLVYVYCNKLVNDLREKFRTFSGDAQMSAEARVSQDRLDDLETNLHIYVDAITSVLDGNRGDWGDGFFYGGGYEVTFSRVKHGGRNFLQTAEITFDLEVSAD
jgi:hypothetical protein